VSLRMGSEEKVALGHIPDTEDNPEQRREVAGRASSVLALVRRELERTWPSYLSATPFNLLFGLLATFMLWLYLSPDAESAPRADGAEFWLDWVFLFVLVNLPVNWTSRSYWHTWRDPFQEHLEFLRALPVPAWEIVAGRALVMAGSTAIMVCAFFLPGYALLPDMREMLALPQLIWLAVTWAGYALVCGGIYLFLEFCVRSSKLRFWMMLLWILPIAGTVLLCNLVLDAPLVAGSLGLIERYEALPALISLAFSAGVFVLLGAATSKGVSRGA